MMCVTHPTWPLGLTGMMPAKCPVCLFPQIGTPTQRPDGTWRFEHGGGYYCVGTKRDAD